MERLEQFKQMLSEIKDYLKEKDQESAEYKQKVEELSKKFNEELEKLRQEIAERKTQKVSVFGDVKDIKSLIEVPAYNDELKRIQKVYDELKVAYDLLGKAGFEKALDFYQYHYPNEVAIIKDALNTSTTGSGADWIPTGYSRSLFEELMLELRVASLHENVDMPQNPYVYPIVFQDSQAYLVAENTDENSTSPVVPGTNPTTGKFTLDAKKLATRVRISDEMTEDSIIPVLPQVRKSIINAIARAIENAIINGDTSATHMDSDVTSANDPRKAFDGYRKIAIADAKVDASGTLDVADLVAVRSKMGKYAVYVNDLVWIVSPTVYLAKLVNLKDENGNPIILTMEKYGNQATILKGEVAKLFGIPVIVSEFVREDLNASGVYDGTTTTQSEIILVNRPSFVLGYRRDLKVETYRLAEQQQDGIVASIRIAFGSPFASRPVVGVLYNVDKA